MIGIGANLKYQPDIALAQSGAVLAYRFADTASLSPVIGSAPMTFSRSNADWEFDSTGTLVAVPANVPAFGYDPVTLAARGVRCMPSTTNSIRNNTGVGAVVGAPGTMPTNWSSTFSAGLAVEIAGAGQEDGIDYVDIRWSGTPTVSANGYSIWDTTIAAAVSQAWSVSAYTRLVAGSLANVTNMRLMLEERTSSASLLQNLSPVFVPTNAALRTQRQGYTAVLSQATTTLVRPALRFTTTLNQAVDFTLRIGLPQAERNAYPTAPMKTTTAAFTRQEEQPRVAPADLAQFLSATELTLLGEFVVDSLSRNTDGIRTIGPSLYASSTNRFRILHDPANAGGPIAISGRINSGTTINADIGLYASTIPTRIKGVFTMKANGNPRGTINGGTVVQHSQTGLLVGAPAIHVGYYPSSNNTAGGYCKSIDLYARALNDTELQQYTV
jgi:hypothetical protein